MNEDSAVGSQNYDQVQSVPGLCRLLMVEDNSGDVGLLQIALRQHGLKPQLFVATDGHEACLLLDRIDDGILPCPDLIVVDLNLPKRNGFEVLQRVRASNKCGDKPVVILSSSDSPAEREKASRFGVTLYLKKPFTLPELEDVGKLLKHLWPKEKTD